MSDVVIIPLYTNQLPEEDLSSLLKAHYIVMSLSVNANMHNTSIVLDQQSKRYYYFDSLGGSCPQKFIQHLQDKGLINQNWICAASSCPQQVDGWSCGFHSIANVIKCIEGKSEDAKAHVSHEQLGNDLRNKYKSSFEEFVKANYSKNETSNRIARRRKIVLKYALSSFFKNDLSYSSTDKTTLVRTDDSRVNGHPLENLYKELCENVGPDSGSSLEEFVQKFRTKYNKDPGQKMALAFLQQATPGGDIYQLLPFTIVEGEETATQIRGVIRFLQTLEIDVSFVKTAPTTFASKGNHVF
jgi:hypothetical protein